MDKENVYRRDNEDSVRRKKERRQDFRKEKRGLPLLRWILITEVKRVDDKEAFLKRRRVIRGRWRIGIAEDLLMEERRTR